ncbi:MAG TPA: Ger(x)C family spore germination protein [Paenibacillus sp.]|uniref:Ger(x)C family spore germination protein n=1 Tax=Paenibacillus sp. TaxID=58172 RepID=UPI002BD8DA7D|nr:Ger(x)C family spore germination protein [Paenibacillus sp.]HUC93102.1 Ger(x)C family spore germination protein [Paenibacillus sp.]
MRKNKTPRIGLFIPAFTLLMTGCWHIIQPENLATISMAGFDKAGGDYKITLQILNPAGIPTAAAGNISTTEKPVRLLTARGKTISEAVHEANRYNPGHHFWGHLSAIVVGETMAREGLGELVDALARSTEMMETADLYIARGLTAEKLLKSTAGLKPYPAEALRKMTTYSSMHTWTKEVRLNQALQTLSYNPGTLVIPGLVRMNPEDPSSPNGKALGLEGLAVLSNWKLRGWMTGAEAKGFLWIMEQIEHQSFHVPYKEGVFDVEALNNDTKMNLTMSEGKVKNVRIRVTTTARLTEVQNIKIDVGGNRKHAEYAVKTAINEEIQSAIEASLKKSQGLHSDIFGLGEQVRTTSPDSWKRIKYQWNDDHFPEIPIHVEVMSTIRDFGELLRNID